MIAATQPACWANHAISAATDLVAMSRATAPVPFLIASWAEAARACAFSVGVAAPFLPWSPTTFNDRFYYITLACAVVEDRRDDPIFDRALIRTGTLRALLLDQLDAGHLGDQIGRASCRERVSSPV